MSREATISPVPCPDPSLASDRFEVFVNEVALGVYANSVHSFVGFSYDFAGGEPVHVRIESACDVRTVAVRPLSAEVQAAVDDRAVSFTLDRPCKLSVEVNDGSEDSANLFLFADRPEEPLPDDDGSDVIHFEPGLHDLEGRDLRLASGQTLYLAPGAVLMNAGTLWIEDAEDVTIRGRGVWMGNTRMSNARRVTVEGIVIHPQRRTWVNRLDACEHVTFRNVKQLCGTDSVQNFDGFDPCSGCRHITIEDIFIRATDDVLSCKHPLDGPRYWATRAPVSDIILRRAVVWNVRGGTLMRIGPETVGPSIERVTMEDVDLIHFRDNPNGSVFEIRTVDGCRVRDLVMRDIRIEEHRRLIRFDMSDWYKTHYWTPGGEVDGVYLRDLDVRGGHGECVIEGADERHTFRNIFFDNIRVDGEPVGSWKDLGGQAAFVENLVFDSDAQPMPDRTPPGIEEVVAVATAPDGSARRIYVLFSKTVERESAEDVANYALSSGADIERAELGWHRRQVTLTTGPLRAEESVSLSVRNVRDECGNPIAEKSRKPVAYRRAWRASEGFGPFQGKLGWFQEQMNVREVRRYAMRREDWMPPAYRLMNYQALEAGGRWMGDRREARITADRQWSGQWFRSVRTWRAPVDGVVKITGRVLPPAGIGGVRCARILHNSAASNRPEDDIELWVGETDGTASPEHTVMVRVAEGDVIRFRLEYNGNGATACAWNPQLRTTE